MLQTRPIHRARQTSSPIFGGFLFLFFVQFTTRAVRNSAHLGSTLDSLRRTSLEAGPGRIVFRSHPAGPSIHLSSGRDAFADAGTSDIGGDFGDWIRRASDYWRRRDYDRSKSATRPRFARRLNTAMLYTSPTSASSPIFLFPLSPPHSINGRLAYA